MESDCCYFCKTEPETLIHLFSTCPIVGTFWTSVFHWLREQCDHIHSTNFNSEQLIFGIVDNVGIDNTTNFIILCAKQFIYNSKIREKTLNLNQFKLWLKTIYTAEKFIAFKNCKWDNFNRR